MSGQHSPETDDHDDCPGCALAPDRRAFIKAAGLISFAALIDVGMPPGLAAAMRPTSVTSRSSLGADPTYPIPSKDGVQIDLKNEVILVRWHEAIYAFNLSCPHQNSALKWSDADTQFQCPKHHSKYQPDGTFITGRATRNMDRFTMTRQGDIITVDVSEMHKNDKDPKGWSASVILLSKGE